MRIVRLMHFSNEYVRRRYAADPRLAELPYEDQKRRIFSDFFGFADSWEYWLRRAGIEATDVPLGIAPLDAAFEREHGCSEAGTDLAAAIAVLRHYVPDVLFLSSIEYWTSKRVAILRAAVPSIRAVLGMAGVDITCQFFTR
jgi:hypothetical protein